MTTQQARIRAKDVMGTDIYYIDGMASAHEAAELMREKQTTTLIVEKRNEDDAWGMVVSQDMVRGVVVANRNADEVHVYEIMSKPLVTVPADMDVRYVAMLMDKMGVGRMPVIENGELSGVITKADLIMCSQLFEKWDP